MTGALRRLERLERRAGIGPDQWRHTATAGQWAALEAVATHGGNISTVRRIFADFVAAYQSGAGVAEMHAAADTALDALKEALPHDAYVMTIAILRHGK